MSDEPPGHPLADAIELDSPERLRAIADPVRSLIVDLVLEHAMSVTELALRVGRAKGTVAHHVDVLCAAGLLQVVATRRVRALEERFYGRTARTFVFPASADGDLPFAAEARREFDRARQAADDAGGFTLRHARIPAERAEEFWQRALALAIEFTKAPRAGDVEHALYIGVFPTNRPVSRPVRPRARRACG